MKKTAKKRATKAPGEVLRPVDVARLCEADLKTVRAWADEGKIRSFRTPGDQRRFRRADVAAFLAEKGYPVPAWLSSEPAADPHPFARPLSARDLWEADDETGRTLHGSKLAKVAFEQIDPASVRFWEEFARRANERAGLAARKGGPVAGGFAPRELFEMWSCGIGDAWEEIEAREDGYIRQKWDGFAVRVNARICLLSPLTAENRAIEAWRALDPSVRAEAIRAMVDATAEGTPGYAFREPLLALLDALS